jgi:hypothetical protein
MIYKAGDSLDPDLFLKKILTGTTPIPDQPDVFRLSDVHERFLAAPGLRLVSDAFVVKQTVLKAIEQGKVVFKSAQGTAYDKAGAVEGPEGQRRAVPGAEPSVSLKEDERITRADSAAAKAWLQVDAQTSKTSGLDEFKDFIKTTPPPELATVIASTWADILKHAETRPLVELTLDAGTPTVADTLAAIAQPLGADQLALDVTVSGDLKSGGTASFAVQAVNLNSPIKPLDSARTLFTAMTAGALTYGARLTLKFNEPGRSGLKAQLETAANKAGDEVTPGGTFGKAAAKKGAIA